MDVDDQPGGAPAFDLEVRCRLPLRCLCRRGSICCMGPAVGDNRLPGDTRCRHSLAKPASVSAAGPCRRMQQTIAAMPESTACCLLLTRALTLRWNLKRSNWQRMH